MAMIEFYPELSDRKDLVICNSGKKIKDVFKDITDWKQYKIICNNRFETEEYNITDIDKIIVRRIPFAISSTFLAIMTGISIAITVAGAIVGGIMIYNNKKEAEKAQKEIEKLKNRSKDEVTNLPYLKGASNTIATGKTQPYIIGEHLNTPYILNGGNKYRGFSTISGERGEEQFYNVVLECGFNKQVFRKIYIDDITLKKFSESEPQEGKYDFESDSVFASEGSFMEIAQDGEPFETSVFNQKIIEVQTNDLLSQHEDGKVYEDKFYTLQPNSMGADVCIMFNGLRKYTDDGTPGAKTRNVIPSYSLDYAHLVAIGDDMPEEHATWVDFSFNQNGELSNTFNYNSLTQMRFNAHVDFAYDEIYGADGRKRFEEPITIKLSTPDKKPSSGSEYSDSYIQWIHSYCYNIKESEKKGSWVVERIIGEREAKLSTILGVRIRATQANEDKLKSIQIITSGCARIWDSELKSWSEKKHPTSSPASWLLEILTSEAHTPSKINDEEIDLNSFGAWFEYCEGKHTVNHVISQGMTKQALIQMILECGRASIYQNIYGKKAIAIDKIIENASGILNEQNMISFSYDKNMNRKVDGVIINYIEKRADYQEESVTIMYDGSDPEERSADSVLTTIRAQGITNQEEAIRHGYYIMKQERLRPKKCKATVGQEGLFFTPLSKFLIQHPSLKVGKGNGEIKNIILDEEEENIIGLELYDTVNLEELNNYSMIVQCVGAYNDIDYCTPMQIDIKGDSGITYEVELIKPIPINSKVIPHAHDIFSYGLDVENITDPMIIVEIDQDSDGYILTLVDYDERIVDDSENVPEYIPDFSTPQIPVKGISDYIVPTVQDIENVREEMNNKVDKIILDSSSIFRMDVTPFVLKRKNDGSFYDDLISANATKTTGDVASEDYAGIWKISYIDESGAIHEVYKSAVPEISINYHAPREAESVIIELFSDSESLRLDRQMVQSLKDGAESALVLLKDTFQSFKADGRGYIEGNPSITTEAVAYIGTEEIECLIDIARLRELNNIPGMSFSLSNSSKLKIEALEGTELPSQGRILVPVLINSQLDIKCYGYVDENQIPYKSVKKLPGAKSIILFFDFQKLEIEDVSRESIYEYTPRYLGKASEPPVVKGNYDYFLYSGERSQLHSFLPGHFYVYYNGKWSEKKDSDINQMDLVFDDMLSLVDTSEESAPVVSIVNRLVTSEAFIDKLATRIITLQEGGIIKSSNYDGQLDDEGKISKFGSVGWAIDYNGQSDFSGVNVSGKIISTKGLTHEKSFVLSLPLNTGYVEYLVRQLYSALDLMDGLSYLSCSGTLIAIIRKDNKDTVYYLYVVNCRIMNDDPDSYIDIVTTGPSFLNTSGTRDSYDNPHFRIDNYKSWMFIINGKTYRSLNDELIDLSLRINF